MIEIIIGRIVTLAVLVVSAVEIAFIVITCVKKTFNNIRNIKIEIVFTSVLLIVATIQAIMAWILMGSNSALIFWVMITVACFISFKSAKKRIRDNTNMIDDELEE